MHWTYQAPGQMVFRRPLIDKTSRGIVEDRPLAVVLALFSTIGFGAAFVLTQFALRWMPPWLGAAFSIPTSTLLFWCLAPFSIHPAEVDLSAAGLFAVIGLLFPAAVTLLNFESNRLMGPNIAGAVAGAAPLFAVLPAVMLLGEHLRFWQFCGIAAIVTGVVLMYSAQRQLHGQETLGPGFAPRCVRHSWLRPARNQAGSGALAQSDCRGCHRLYGLVGDAGPGRPGEGPRARTKLRPSLWFAAVGLCNGSAVLSMYTALGRGPITLIAPLIATHPLVTLLLSFRFNASMRGS